MTGMVMGNHFQWFILMSLLLIPAGFPTPWAFGADSDTRAIAISVNAENETLMNILGKISQISGYEIEFDQEWGNHPVNIRFENESLEAALSRVLANLNHALIWNDSEKKISIFINGKVSARGIKPSPSDSSSSSVSRGSEVQRRPVSKMPDRQPSRSPNEIRGTAPPKPIRPQPGQAPQSEGDVPVSVTGRKTRFGQATSTID